MMNAWIKIKRFMLISLVFVAAVLLLQRSVLKPGDITQRVHGFTRAIEFDYGRWGLEAMGLKLAHLGLGAVDYLPKETQKQLVLDYLDLVRRIYQAEAGKRCLRASRMRSYRCPMRLSSFPGMVLQQQ